MTTANDILTIARHYLGSAEGGSNHRHIIDTYNATKPLPRGYTVKYTDDWCATFVSFVGIEAGVPDLYGRECGVERFIDIFKSKGIWLEDGTITPKPGDIITYNWDTKTQPNNGFADHIGFVESVSGGVITTIEGNYGDSVRRRTISVGAGNIRGYARPKYGAGSGSSTSTATKSVATIAQEVINGKWGNGADRTAKLTAAGYNAASVQAEVNRQLGATSKPKPVLKSIATVAQEVINGAWGNGADRTNRLAKAGYDPKKVQAEVNKLLNGNKKSLATIAQEVINGDWGNGATRTAKLKAAGYDPAAVQKLVNKLL